MSKLALLESNLVVNPLVWAIQQNDYLWNQHTARQKIYNSPHTQMSDIWVRYNHIDNLKYENDLTEFNSEHESVWYPCYYDVLKPYIDDLIFPVMLYLKATRLGAVLITKIPPGGRVDPHIDAGWHANYYEKFAIQLQSAPGQYFKVEELKLETKPGDLFQFDNSKVHAVYNNSNYDRMTMIVCVKR